MVSHFCSLWASIHSAVPVSFVYRILPGGSRSLEDDIGLMDVAVIVFSLVVLHGVAVHVLCINSDIVVNPLYRLLSPSMKFPPMFCVML